MVWAFDQICPSPAAKLVLLKLGDHANDEGECWPSQRRIAEDCGLTRQTVNEQIRKLIELGLLNTQNRFDGTGQLTNRYFLPCRQIGHPLSADPTPLSAQATPPVGSADTEPSLNLKEEASPIGEAKKDRGTRLPDDFVVPEAWKEKAVALREKHSPHAPIDVEAEAVKFVLFWSAKAGAGATKRDWEKTFYNWCLNAKGGRANGHSPDRESTKAFTTEELWRGRLLSFRNKGTWPVSGWGPAPSAPGCQAPLALLHEFGHIEHGGEA